MINNIRDIEGKFIKNQITGNIYFCLRIKKGAFNTVEEILYLDVEGHIITSTNPYNDSFTWLKHYDIL